ncbi:hypothetical protein R1flu_024635 [Riccia fluitans]|uniref:Ribosomal protein S14 n=1 Tax=Riccia fluitans TaxID=41844 RepID=A0ABD1XZK0_9MARC
MEKEKLRWRKTFNRWLLRGIKLQEADEKCLFADTAFRCPASGARAGKPQQVKWHDATISSRSRLKFRGMTSECMYKDMENGETAVCTAASSEISPLHKLSLKLEVRSC